MNNNPINEAVKVGRIEATDDVEGHGARTSHIDTPDTDDVEAHGRVRGIEADQDDDTEGHGARIKI